MARFKYYSSSNLREACQLLRSRDSEIIAGGTDLITRMKLGLCSPLMVVDVTKIAELKTVGWNGQELVLGAGVTLDELEHCPPVLEYYPSLARAAGAVASWQIRNCGTIGGNICQDTRCHYYNQSVDWRRSIKPCFRTGGDLCHQIKSSKNCVALYCSDLAAILAAFGAKMVISDSEKERTVDVLKLRGLPGEKPYRYGEIITKVIIPAILPGTGQVYIREAARMGLDFPLASVGIVVTLLEDDHFSRAEIVIGAVNSKLVRVDGVCDFLNQKGTSTEVYETIAKKASNQVFTIPELNYSTSYRKELIRVIVKRGLEMAVNEARDKNR